MASVLPSGTVGFCIGDCPMGTCDDQLFFSSRTCSSVYSGPVSPTSTFCNPGQTGVYCLRIIPPIGQETRFGITCTNGVATGQYCPACVVAGDELGC
jgi:hypothetical protein